MNAVPFDTLKLARKLEASGMAGPMAAGTAEVMSGAELATKADVAAGQAETASLRTELKAEIANLRTELKAEIASLRAELKADGVSLRGEFKSDIEILRRDLVIKLGGMLVISVGILLTAIRYLPPHP
jgi:hypothetical protein